MITSRTALAIGKLYHAAFTCVVTTGVNSGDRTFSDQLFEFLVSRNYPPFFCDRARRCRVRVDVRDIFLALERGAGMPTVADSEEAHAFHRNIGQALLKTAAADILDIFRARIFSPRATLPKLVSVGPGHKAEIFKFVADNSAANASVKESTNALLA